MKLLALIRKTAAMASLCLLASLAAPNPPTN